MRQLPNIITLIRLAAAPLVARLIAQARYREALSLSILAGLTDWLDGFAARTLNSSSKTGVILDPMADKILLVIVFVQLAFNNLVPLWMLLLALIRDLVIVIGALLLRLFRNIRRFYPSVLGKISTFFQIMLVVAVLLNAAFPCALPARLVTAALVLSAAFTTLSGLDYIRRGLEMARQPAAAS